MNISDNNLIFLISQPRSGSSLLQQLLNSHPSITSLPEPWLMLPLVFSYKHPGIESVYNSEFAHACLTEYLNHFKDGMGIYKRNIRKLALDIYELGFQKDEKAVYFVDKTPRYYHIINELVDIFPDARFILLSRNPAAVFASILDYNFHGNYKKMLGSADRLEDIFTGPTNLLAAKEKFGDSVLYIKYEDVVKDAKTVMDKIYRYLELKIPDDSTRYHLETGFKNTTSIDTKSVHKHDRPVDSYIDSWKTSIDSQQKKMLIMDYMNMLPEIVVSGLGYSRDGIISQLKDHPVKSSVKPRHIEHFLENIKTESPLTRGIQSFNNNIAYPLRRSIKRILKRPIR